MGISTKLSSEQSMLLNSETDQLAQIIWDYHRVNQPLEKADCMLTLGSNDVRVAEYAAELYIKDMAPIIVFSGHKGQLTEGWERSEADVFAEAALAKGVPKDKILIENQSTNTGKNIIFSRHLLEKHGINPTSIILVHKPYMERRSYATCRKVWPEVQCIVTSPPISFQDYPNNTIPKDVVINQMVADLQRILLYPARGFQIEQEVPENVLEAYNELIVKGYTKRMLKE